MFKLNFVTPEKKIVTDQKLEEITLPAFKGELNILPGHAPLMTTLEAGIVHYRLADGTQDRFAISWGYCQVSGDGVSVLAETALAKDEIDSKAVAEHLKEKEALLITQELDDHGWVTLQHEIARLKAELQLAAER